MIFTISKGANQWDDTQVVVRSLVTGEQTVLVEGGADGRYVRTGHLVYVRLGTLMAAPFDPVRLVLTAGATGLIEGVMQAADLNLSDMDNTLSAQFTVSDTGALVYVTGGVLPATQRSLAWVDRQGMSQALSAPPRAYRIPRLSPDGRHVAVYMDEGIRQVWSYDIARGALSAVTVDGRSSYGIFSPDQKRIAFRLGWRAVTTTCTGSPPTGVGPRNASPRVHATRRQSPGRPTGRRSPLSKREIPLVRVRSLSLISGCCQSAIVRPERLSRQPPTSWHPSFPLTAAGWRTSHQSGRSEVYVQPYPGPGERHLISTNGGTQPAWNGNGRELFYVQGAAGGGRVRQLMSVSIRTTPTFVAGAPETLLKVLILRAPGEEITTSRRMDSGS